MTICFTKKTNEHQHHKNRFKVLCDRIFQNTFHTVRKALLDARMDDSMIHDIVLVSKSTRIANIQMTTVFFQKEENKSVHPDEAVADLAAIHVLLAGIELEKVQDILILDSVIFENKNGGIMKKIIALKATISTKTQIFSTNNNK
jgi:heat shock 70kDa protein 1/2/6/8